MMKSTKISIFCFLAFISIVFLMGCKFAIVGPEKPITKPKHVNKFTCKVDGEFWEAIPKEYDGSFNSNDLDVSLFTPHSSFDIIANNIKEDAYLAFSFSLSDTTKVITKLLNGYFANKCSDDYRIDSNSIRINITKFNRDSSLLKGNFRFKVFTNAQSCKDTISITDGFFDLKYYY